MIFACEKIERFAPRPTNAARARVWDDYVSAFEMFGDALASEFGLDEPLEVQHFMAQIAHESAGFTILWENMAYSAERILQIFGEGHHSAAVTPSEARHLERNPDALAERVYGLGNPRKARELGNTEPGDGFRYRGFGLIQTTGRAAHNTMLGNQTTPVAALRAAFTEWDHRGCNDHARNDDIKTITKRINGGFNGIADRRAWLARAKKVWPTLPRPASTVSADVVPIDAGSSMRVSEATSMWNSTTARASEAIGGGASANTAAEVAQAVVTARRAPGGFSAADFVLGLASSVTFWIGLGTICLAAYIWFERRRKFKMAGATS